MKLPQSSCWAVAASLAARYTAPLDLFTNSSTTTSSPSSITDLLQHHGILLTMCLEAGNECLMAPDATPFIASSWIHPNVTGDTHLELRIVHRQTNGLGLVLQPNSNNQTQVRCLYPTNGDTAGRLDRGCGVDGLDPNAPWDANTRRRHKQLRQSMQRYKDFNFGPSMAFTDISCRAMFVMNSVPCFKWSQKMKSAAAATATTANGTFSMADTDRYALVDCDHNDMNWTGSIMGHPVCRWDDAGHFAGERSLGDNNQPSYAWLWSGQADSWKPNQWRDALQQQYQLIQAFPHYGIWNEFVLETPTTLGDVVEAVFFFSTAQDRDALLQRAHRRAAVLGNQGVPVVEFVLNDQGRLVHFDCPPPPPTTETEQSGNGYHHPQPVRNRPVEPNARGFFPYKMFLE